MNIGIIGLGHIAHRFAGVLKTLEQHNLTAVAARDQSRADAFTAQYQAGRAYGSYQELIDDPAVEGIYIAVTHNFHFDIIKNCLEHGKAVLCEKPMVITLQEARTLTDLARQNNVLLMEAMWSRYLPAFLKARSWVEEGRIGELRLIQASLCYKFPFDPLHRLFNPDLAGGSLYDLGVYPIDFAIGIAGQAPDQSSCVMHLCPTGVDDAVAMSLSFPRFAQACLSCGTSVYSNTDAMIFGTEGSIIVRDFIRTKQCELYNADRQMTEQFNAEEIDGFSYQINHFSDLFASRQIESPLLPWSDTLACCAVFDDLLATAAGKI